MSAESGLQHFASGWKIISAHKNSIFCTTKPTCPILCNMTHIDKPQLTGKVHSNRKIQAFTNPCKNRFTYKLNFAPVQRPSRIFNYKH